MAFFAPIGALAGSGFLGVAGKAVSALLPKAKPQAGPITPVTPTRNAAADMARQADLLRRRRGSSANDLTGGAEASTAGAKTLLGQ